MPFEIAMSRGVVTQAKTELILRPVWIDDPIVPEVPLDSEPAPSTVEHVPIEPPREPESSVQEEEGTVEMPEGAVKWVPLLDLTSPVEVPWCKHRGLDGVVRAYSNRSIL